MALTALRRAKVLDVCDEAEQASVIGTVPDLASKTRFRRDGAYSVELCTAAATRPFSITGAAGLYKKRRAQRLFRDAHAIASHIAFSFESAGTLFGRLSLGLDIEATNL